MQFSNNNMLRSVLRTGYLCLFSGLLSTQVNAQTEIQQLSAKPDFSNLLNTTYSWPSGEREAYETIANSTYFSGGLGTASEDGVIHLSFDNLRTLKDLLDVMPANPAIKKWDLNPVGDQPPAACSTPYNNLLSEFRKVAINYLNYDYVASSGYSSPSVFDVTITGQCSQQLKYALHVDAFTRVGFGTNIPQAQYHFKEPDFQVGDNTTAQLKIDPTAKSLTFSNNGYQLFQVKNDGKVYAREFEITLASSFPDYVFDKDYKLAPLAEVEQYIQANQHLPGIKSACEYEEAGTVDMGELQLKLLEKVEELTMYTIQLQKDNAKQQQEIEALKKALAEKQ